MRDQITARFVALVLALSLAATGCHLPAAGGPESVDARELYATSLRRAEQGDATSQGALGFMYSRGMGVPQDYAEAAKWYRKAADQGNAAAQQNLGFMYATGQGVPQDYAGAAKWYRKAADQGNATAQRDLGLLYAGGLGVPYDKVQAYKWFTLAASSPISGPQVRDSAVRVRDLVAAKMTPAQIAEAQQLVRDWKPTK
jgi:TPR repeat protein